MIPFLDYLVITLGFIFTFFVPGYVILETFFKRFSKLEKLPICLIISVLISTWGVYLFGLILGYSRYSIALCFLIFAFWLLFLFWKRKTFEFYFLPKHWAGILLGVFIFLIFVVALYPAIFFKYQNHYVMSADNWQDTAMHMSIIQSISQGNFPPQAPYYSGAPLEYYYFTDFHTAIISTLVRQFVPRVLVVDNSLFVFIYSLALYLLTLLFFRNRKAALVSAILGVFGGNFMFLKFIQDLIKTGLGNILNLLKSGAYTMEYSGLMQTTPVVDYFLQNRPMMVGLPGCALATYLIISGFRKCEGRRLFLASLIVGMLTKFQMFAFGVSVIIFAVAFVAWLKKTTFRNHLFQGFTFMLPVCLFLLVSLIGATPGHSPFEMIKQSFSWGPWDKTKDFIWFVKFHLANFGLPLIGGFIFILLVVFRKIKIDRKITLLIIWFVLMFVLPHLARFTILDRDMFKFFYIMAIPLALICGYLFVRASRKKLVGFLLWVLILMSSLTSALTLIASFLNKNYAYSIEDYEAGSWIRGNTPAQAVFIECPKVHSPLSDIGGRVRVLSYINWPHSHGYNVGPDNVFVRLQDIDTFFNGGPQEQRIILSKYGVDFVFYGPEERRTYQKFEKEVGANPLLELVYSFDDTQIYRVKRSQLL